MKIEQPNQVGDSPDLPRMPGWVTSAGVEDIEAVAFRSGAALAVLQDHLGTYRTDIPQDLLRDRLALQAAEAGLIRAGRRERAAEIRDEVHLQRPGECLGPAGEMFRTWRRVARLSLKGIWRARLAKILAAEDELILSETAPLGSSVGQGVAILNAALRREITWETAVMLADCTLSKALGWPFPVPLLGAGLKRADMRKEGVALLIACHRAVSRSAARAVTLSGDLTRRAERLRAVAPKLRAKGAGEAVKLFLTEDALTPSVALSPVIRGSKVEMTGRSARRLCDRLVALGAVRELTGRDAFRLYGV